MPTIVTMPKWGLTMTAGTITGWSREEGDPITEGAPLLTVETEKAVDDVESPATGILRKIVAAVGSEVPVMGPVAVITAADEVLSDEDLAALVSSSAAPAASGGVAAPRAAREARPAARDEGGRVNASPAARKRAGELGIDLSEIEATGPGGRITSDDVERAAAAAVSAAAAPRAEMVQLADGTSIYALVAEPAEAKETLVFLHGLGGSQSTWASVLGNLAQRQPDRRHRSCPAMGRATSRLQTLLAIPSPISPRRSARSSNHWTWRPLSSSAIPLAARPRSNWRSTGPNWCEPSPSSTAPGWARRSVGICSIASRPNLRGRKPADFWSCFSMIAKFILERGIDDMHATRSAPGADIAVKAAAASAFSREGQQTVYLDRLGELDIPVLLLWGELDRVIPARHAVAAAQARPSAWMEIT